MWIRPSIESSILAKAPKLVSLVTVAVIDPPHGKGLVDRAPGFGRQAPQAQADALAILVHVHHVDVHLLPDVQHFAGVIDAVPGKLRKMDQSVGAAQVHERAEARCW